MLLSAEISVKKLHYKEDISCNSLNNTVLLKNDSILQIDKIYIPPNEGENAIQISGNILNPEKSIFTYSCNSKSLNMWKVTKSHIRKICILQTVVLKMVSNRWQLWTRKTLYNDVSSSIKDKTILFYY